MGRYLYDPHQGKSLSDTLGGDIPWPKRAQRLIAAPTKDTPQQVTAHLDWLQTFNADGLLLPEAYKDSGDFLVQALMLGGDGTHPDRFLFPILYLYRHAAELRLKELLRIGLRLRWVEPSEALDEILNDHKLYPLWNRARGVLERAWPNADTEDLAAVEGMISQLHQTDRDGQRLRYSHRRSGRPFEYRLPEQVDLLNVRTVFAGLWGLLGGSIDGLTEMGRASEDYTQDAAFALEEPR